MATESSCQHRLFGRDWRAYQSRVTSWRPLPTIRVKAPDAEGGVALCAAYAERLTCGDPAVEAAAHHARRLLRTPRAVRIANRVGATSLGGAAAVIATR